MKQIQDCEPPVRRRISNIVILGLVSLFMDMSTEMVYPIIPLFLTASLGATPAIVGVIEGIAESLAALLKVFSGAIGDLFHRKKRLTFLGYGLSVVYKLILLAATSWPGVLAARVVDRTGKGIRTAPRDALVAESCDSGKIGGAYGLHKMLDKAGSAIGVLFAFFFVFFNAPYNTAFMYSVIPALIAVALIAAVREPKAGTVKFTRLSLKGLKLDPRLKLRLAVMFVFCLGNSSNAFLLLKAQESGFAASNVILLYLVFSLAASIFAWPSGRFADRFGRSAVLTPGYLIYGLCYLGFALASSQAAVWVLFAVYGVGTSLVSCAERAYIAQSAPPGFTGTVLGLYGMLQGIGLLIASLIAGVLWDSAGSDAPFYAGGIFGVIAALAMLVMTVSDKRRTSQNAA